MFPFSMSAHSLFVESRLYLPSPVCRRAGQCCLRSATIQCIQRQMPPQASSNLPLWWRQHLWFCFHRGWSWSTPRWALSWTFRVSILSLFRYCCLLATLTRDSCRCLIALRAVHYRSCGLTSHSFYLQSLAWQVFLPQCWCLSARQGVPFFVMMRLGFSLSMS